MKRFLLSALCAIALSAPAHAETSDTKKLFPTEEDLQQLGQMAQLWMRQLADQMHPMAERLKDMVDDLDRYEAPEFLPNGDIIIRRKPDAPKPSSPEEIEL